MNVNDAIAAIVKSVPQGERAKVANRALIVLAIPRITGVLTPIVAAIVAWRH